MKKKPIAEWAALAEIASAIAVVISLLFVAHTIERNTAATQAQNDNLLYEMDLQLNLARMNDPTFAAIYVKHSRGETLDVIEQFRFTALLEQYLNMWELAWDRHRSGLFSDEKWLSWDATVTDIIMDPLSGLSREQWSGMQQWYLPGFVEHVDAAYAAQQRADADEPLTRP